MKDLIYDPAAKSDLLKRYPNAVIVDEWDYIHESRFTIEFEGDKYEYFHYLVDTGIALVSLAFQLWYRGEWQEAKPYLEKWLAIKPKPKPKQYKLNRVGIRILD